MAGISKQKESNFYLYKIIDKDELVYIGKSINIDNRIANHNIVEKYINKDEFHTCRGESISNLKIFVTSIQDEYLLSIYEITLISKYKPIYNTSDKYNTKYLLKLPKLNWFPYVSEEDCQVIYAMRTGKSINSNCIDTPLKRWNILKRLHMEDNEC